MNQELLRKHLLRLQDAIQGNVVSQQMNSRKEDLSSLAEITQADAIYRIDKVSEEFVLEWFRETWPRECPVELIMEGIEDGTTVFPEGTPPENLQYTCIIDPIDGTRCIMDDKRSAWVLTGIAPRENGQAPTLRDIEVVAMTELPPTKQRLADQLTGIRGRGKDGIQITRRNLDNGKVAPIKLQPSRARDLLHGHGIVAKFFPEAKTLLTQFEEALIDRLYGLGETSYPRVFDDQYPSTGGQFYELLAGRDRMVLDLRPLAFRKTGNERCLGAHPYDICTALLLEETGCPIMGMDGGPLDAPLDTTSPVGFMAYANEDLRNTIHPEVMELVEKFLL